MTKEQEKIEKAISNVLRGNDIESASYIVEKVALDNYRLVTGRINVFKIATRQLLDYAKESKEKGVLDYAKENVKLKEQLKEKDNIIKSLLDSLDSVVWYNGHYEKLEKIKNEISEMKENEIYRFDYGNEEQFQVIWMILVELFGDCGTSPRSGWLEMKNRDKIIKFIDRITKTSREDLGGSDGRD